MTSTSLKLLIGLLASAALPAFTLAEESAAPPLQWETSFPRALERAVKEKRLVLVDFWRDNCVYCDRMEQQTFKDPRVVQLLSGYVPARIKNTEHPAEIQRYQVDGFPTLALLDEKGNAIDVFTGFQPAGEFLSWLATNADKHARYQRLQAQIEKDPSDLGARLALGRLYSGDGKREQARECLEALVRADPSGKRYETGEALLEIGLTWRRSREFRRAAESLARAREIALALPASAPAGGASRNAPAPANFLDRALYELAVAHLLAGSRKELVATLEEYDSKVASPDARRHAWALLQLGQSLRKEGNLEAAKRAFQRCDQLYPSSPEARESRQELKN